MLPLLLDPMERRQLRELSALLRLSHHDVMRCCLRLVHRRIVSHQVAELVQAAAAVLPPPDEAHNCTEGVLQ